MNGCTARVHMATANEAGAMCHCGKYRLELRTSSRSWLAFRLADEAAAERRDVEDG